MDKVRTSITIDRGLLTQVKVVADHNKNTLSEIVEEALKVYLPPAIAIERTSQGTVYKSGLTVQSMQPNVTMGVVSQPKPQDSRIGAAISEMQSHDITHGLPGEDMLKSDNSWKDPSGVWREPKEK